MIEMSTTQLQSYGGSTQPKISPATNEDILAYLRHSYKLAEIATLAERNVLILDLCERLDITVSDEELQAAGDTFRLEHKLLGTSETLAWIQKQQITVEDWSYGVRIKLLAKKLKEHLFGDTVDSYYLNNRDRFKRVALSQVLCRDLTDALKVIRAIREENVSFCTLALEYSKGKQSQENGGFVGVRFLDELMPEIAQVVIQGKIGEVLEPIQSKLGYHILRIEKWYPTELNDEVREKILESLFENWFREQIYLERERLEQLSI
jgi:parvulin-like peptidyl-prolyl isomerase